MAVDMLQSGVQWLHAVRGQSLISEVIYRRQGVEDKTIYATRGQTTLEVQDADGLSIRSTVVDFIFNQDEIQELFPPIRGDMVVADGRQYEVLDLAPDGFWRWSDPYHHAIRVHTKDIGSSAI